MKTVLFFKRNSLEVYVSTSEGPKGKLEFPVEIVKYEEIIDEVKFEALVTSFLQKELGSGQKVVILLSRDVVFQKTVPIKENIVEKDEVEKFTSAIPFDASKAVTVKVNAANGLNLIATNKKLYLPIVTACEKLSSRVESVVPAPIFGVGDAPVLTEKDISQIFKNSKLVEASNFLLTQTEGDLQADQAGSKSFVRDRKNLLFVVFAVLFIVIAVSALVYTKQKRQAVSEKKAVEITQVSPTPAATEESTVSAKDEEVSKEALKIQILNGTGVAGQAQDLADLLKSDGFGEITLGNVSAKGDKKTTVGLKESVSSIIKDEVTKKLEDLFETVEAVTLSESEFDIEITTGNLKPS